VGTEKRKKGGKEEGEKGREKRKKGEGKVNVRKRKRI